VHIAIPQQRDVFVQDVQPNMYDAIDNAIRRAGRSLRRTLARPRSRRQREQTELQRMPLEPRGAGV
jgi:ribosome-associated translation inhibitor RaiA